MELRHLRYFLVVAEELHFGKAAERLLIAQPPLSRQIQDLEAELGVKLFSRINKRVTLTSAGEIFRQHVLRTMESVDIAIQATQQADRGEDGILRVGFLGSASFSFLPKSIRSFRKQFPRVEIALHEMRSSEQIDALVKGTLDVGIVRVSESKQTQIEFQVVLREPFVVALPTRHPLARRGKISISNLASEGFVHYPRDRGPGLFQQVNEICQQAGFKPTVVQHASNISTIVSFVAAGLGVAILPESISKMPWSGVIYRPLQGATIESVIAIAFRKDSNSVLHKHFIDCLASR